RPRARSARDGVRGGGGEAARDRAGGAERVRRQRSRAQPLPFTRLPRGRGVDGEGGLTRGQIVLDRVSRRFRVRESSQRTIKELFVSRGRTRTRDVRALRDVSLRAEPGEARGLVGPNGSGKPTLLRLVSQIIKPTSGTLEVDGRVGSLLELGAGFHAD